MQFIIASINLKSFCNVSPDLFSITCCKCKRCLKNGLTDRSDAAFILLQQHLRLFIFLVDQMLLAAVFLQRLSPLLPLNFKAPLSMSLTLHKATFFLMDKTPVFRPHVRLSWFWGILSRPVRS